MSRDKDPLSKLSLLEWEIMSRCSAFIASVRINVKTDHIQISFTTRFELSDGQLETVYGLEYLLPKA